MGKGLQFEGGQRRNFFEGGWEEGKGVLHMERKGDNIMMEENVAGKVRMEGCVAYTKLIYSSTVCHYDK